MLANVRFSEDGASFGASAEWFSDGSPPTLRLSDLLHVQDMQATPLARRLDEEDADDLGTLPTMVRRLSHGFHAYQQFQDSLQITFTSKEIGSSLNPYNRHYLYYESIVYLRESMVSWLNGAVLAGCTLLRPFVELAVFHLYWRVKGERDSFTPYYRWLCGSGHKPSFKEALDTVIDDISGQISQRDRINRLRSTIRDLYKTLCSYNHSPQFEESLTHVGGGPGEVSYDNLYYYTVLCELVLVQVTLLYCLAYPAVLFPRELYIKWGFGGPAGLLVDPRTSCIVSRFIGDDSFQSLRKLLQDTKEVQYRLDYYDQAPPLSPQELELDWRRFLREAHIQSNKAHTDLGQRITIAKAHYRALGWALSYQPLRSSARAQSVAREELQDAHTNALKW